MICAWFGAPRRTVCYTPIRAAPTVSRFATPVRTLIEESPSLGYRTAAFLPDFNKNTVQRPLPWSSDP